MLSTYVVGCDRPYSSTGSTTGAKGGAGAGVALSAALVGVATIDGVVFLGVAASPERCQVMCWYYSLGMAIFELVASSWYTEP